MDEPDNQNGAAPVDRLLDGRLLLEQPARGHRAGTDAILLAACAPQRRDGVILDLGCGVGTAGLAVALRTPGARVVLVDNDPGIAEFAARNIALNRVEDRVGVILADALTSATRREAGLADGIADAVITNPPFLARARGRISPDSQRARAHVHASENGLDLWLRAVAALLRPDGQMALIHRADHLAEVLAACAGRFGDLTIRPVHPKSCAVAIRILVTGRRGSRAPLRLLPPLVLHEADGAFTPLAEALHRGAALLA